MNTSAPIIAVIDDDPSILKALNRLLTVSGCQVHTFSSGFDFWINKTLADWDFIISDVHMPKMNGLELQNRLLAYGYWPSIIFVTAYDDPQAKSMALKAGALAYLQKPLDHNHLLKTINLPTIIACEELV